MGGWLREAWFGRESRDVDLIIAGELAPALAALGQALGAEPFCLSARFGSWRIVKAGYSIDISAVPDGLAADLLRRDYTVNTLRLPAEYLGAAPEEPALHAALACHPQALGDLSGRVLRMCSREALEEDPLRILRGYRFCATQGLAPEAQTRSAWRSLAGRLPESAPERLHEELLRWLAAPEDPGYGVPDLATTLGWAAEDGALWALFPPLREAPGCEQNAYHHLDVWSHTLECLRQLERLHTMPPAPLEQWTGGLLSAWDGAVSGQASAGALTRLALLLHDIAKPATRALQPDGRVTFYGHQELGARWARELLGGLKFSGDEIDFVTLLVAEHLRIGFYCDHEPLPPRLIYRFLSRLGEAAPLMVLHALADCAATGGEGAEANWQRHLRAAEVLLRHHFEPSVLSRPPLLLDGNAIMELLGLPPGPRIGEIKAALLEATAAGEVSNVEEAREFAIAFASADA